MPTLRKLSRTLVSLALAVSPPPTARLVTYDLLSGLALTHGVDCQVGRAQGDPRLTRAGEAARMLSRPIAIAANDR